MITAAELAEHRADAVGRMDSEAEVRNPTGAMTRDPATGRDVPEWAPAYRGVCRLRGARSGANPSRRITQSGGVVEHGTPEVHVPVEARGIIEGAVVAIVAGECAGTWWQVVNADLADQQTALRLPVVAVPRPEGWL